MNNFNETYPKKVPLVNIQEIREESIFMKFLGIVAVRLMVLILDGNSEQLAHVPRKSSLFEQKIKFATSYDL